MSDTERIAGGGLAAGVTRVGVTRHEKDRGELERDDWVIVEEPLQIRVSGEPLLVTMRTPGHDHELAAGYLLAEGLIASANELGSIRHCDPGPEPENNVIDVLPAPGSALCEQLPERRHLTTSACGLCGRLQIDDLLARVAPLERRACWSPSIIRAITHKLAEFQKNHQRTGGGHAAGVTDRSGHFRTVREDIGRHNAVDKVVGRLLLDGALPASGSALIVSGRVSFEIVQKAAVAGVELVIGVSAPSSLAIETARGMNLTLVGFSRPGSFNVYAGRTWVAAE